MRALLCATALVAALGGPALARSLHGQAVTRCPVQPQLGSDGCIADPLGASGNFKVTDFFTSMQQSQAGLVLATDPIRANSKNVAGVTPGYTLGLPSKIFTGSITGTALTVVGGGLDLLVGDTIDEGCGNYSTSCGIAQGTHIIGGAYPNYALDVSYGTPLAVRTLYAQTLYSPNDNVHNGNAPAPGVNTGGCVYSATGGTGGVPRLLCSGMPLVALSQIDFSPSNRCLSSGVTGCVNGAATSLQFTNNTSVVLAFNKFVSDANLNANNQSGNASYQIRAVAGNMAVSMIGGIYDGCGKADAYCSRGFNNYENVSGTFSGAIVNDTSTSSWLIKYGAWMNVDGHFIARAHNANGNFYETDFNYICGMVFGTNAVHGEFDLAGVEATTLGFKYDHNTFCEPNNATTNKDGYQLVANTYVGQSFIDGWSAGSLSALKVAGGQTVANGPGTSGIQASTLLSFYGTGTLGSNCTTGATPATATCIGINKPATTTASSPVLVYGGTGSGNATTVMIAPWGLSTSAVVTSMQVTDNTFMVNYAPLYGGDVGNCSIPLTNSSFCFATSGTGMVELEWNQYSTPIKIGGNYGWFPGSFYWYSVLTASFTTATISGAVLTIPYNEAATNNHSLLGHWIIDSAAQTFNGGPPIQISSHGTSIGGGLYTYTLTGSPADQGPVTLYARQALIDTTAANNIDMADGSVINPPTTACCDAIAAEVHR